MAAIRRLAVVLVVLALASAGALMGAGLYLSAAANHPVASPDDLAVQDVAIPSRSGTILAGWYLVGNPGAGAVVLMPGWTSTRRSMLRRMRFLYDAGYAVLAFDFQGHGESPGHHITFGKLEALDAESAVRWMRATLPRERIGVIGVSLGGAAALLAPDGLAADALVLESVFPDLHRAVANRVAAYVGPAAEPVTTAFLAVTGPALGIDDADVRPIDRIADIGVPVFVIAGERDTRTPIAEARELFARARDPKQIWEIPGAAHVDFERFAARDYRRRILEFFGTYLRDG
ncbi:MAG: alpha/beta hydrolase [Gemmatimonas sp.]